jgi:arylsulfatase A-like enzyme
MTWTLSVARGTTILRCGTWPRTGSPFRQHFVSNALCCPSRATILRGQYGHNTGILTNSGPDGGFARFRALGREASTVATWLQAVGYRTGLIGKYLHGYQPGAAQPPGWSKWAVGGEAYDQYNYDLNVDGHNEHHGATAADYLQDVLSTKAVAFVKGSEPFFLYLAPFSPHGPAPYAARHAAAFPGVTSPRDPTFNEPDVSQQPAWLQSQPLMSPAEVTGTNTVYRNRLRSMLAVDETVGAITAALQAAGRLDNTYIVFTSDNGFHLGQHRLDRGKQTQFGEDLHVPLLVRGPGVSVGVVDAMTVNVDFAPTFAELGGRWRRRSSMGGRWCRGLGVGRRLRGASRSYSSTSRGVRCRLQTRLEKAMPRCRPPTR